MGPKHWFSLSSRWLLIPPILLGLGLMGMAVVSREGPEPEAPSELARTLSVVSVRRAEVTPRVMGYGLAHPAQIWKAVAQVGGHLVEVHPDLNSGAVVSSGESLLRIDPTDYRLAIERLEAEISAIEAQIAESAQSQMNLQATLKIERESILRSARELERARRLAANESVSVAEIDQLERDYLLQNRRIQDLKNSLSLIPIQVQRLEANLDSTTAQRRIAERDLDRTRITAPFRARLAGVDLELGQYVAPGQTLFEIHDVTTTEVEARIPWDDLPKLADVNQSPGQVAWQSPFEILKGIDAIVRVRSGDYVRQWPAHLVRVRETVDRRTRSLGVVVQVDHAEESSFVQPPLLEGTFCEVEFHGRPRPGRLVVPRSAVRNGVIYLVDDQDRLRRRVVTTRLSLGEEVVIEGDVREGDRVVITDPTPAVDGQLVEAVERSTLARSPSKSQVKSGFSSTDGEVIQ